MWLFLQYQLAIFLVTAIRPSTSSSTIDRQCPICQLYFNNRYHHCFLVNRCIALCNVHCFLSFTFHATIAMIICFIIFLKQFFFLMTIGIHCLLPMGEFLCQNMTWYQRGMIMLTRSTLIAAGCAGMMGVHVAKEYYFDEQLDKARSIWREFVKISMPAFSIIRQD